MSLQGPFSSDLLWICLVQLFIVQTSSVAQVSLKPCGFGFWRAIQSLILATMADVISALSMNKRIPRELDDTSQRTHYLCDFAVVWHRRTAEAAGLPARAQEELSGSANPR